jgi:hypothetical protein
VPPSRWRTSRRAASAPPTVDPAAVPLLGITGASIVKLTDADFRTDLDRTVAKSTDTPSTLTAEDLRGAQGCIDLTRRRHGIDPLPG